MKYDPNKDYDQADVYSAQNSTGLHASSRQFSTLAEMEDYVNDVIVDPTVRKMFQPPSYVEVQFSKSKKVSYAYTDDIGGHVVFGLHGRNAFTALHEIAHLLSNGDGHGARWRMTFLFLVRRFIGIQAFANLKYEFDQADLTDNIFQK